MLEAKGIRVAYGSKPVLKTVSCSLYAGEVVAVIGPNGAGKSTLLAAISGAIQPSSGTVAVNGVPLHTLAPEPLALRRAVLEQTPVKDLPYTVETLVGLTIPRSVPPHEADQIIARALQAVELAPDAQTPVQKLSGGQAHRAHLARALAQLWAGRALGHGHYLLIDEPTASLDLQHQRSVLDVVRLVASDGAGVLIVLHDLTLAAAIADRVVLMHKGRIAADAVPSAVMQPELIEQVYETPVIVSQHGGQNIIATDYRPKTQSHPKPEKQEQTCLSQ